MITPAVTVSPSNLPQPELVLGPEHIAFLSGIIPNGGVVAETDLSRMNSLMALGSRSLRGSVTERTYKQTVTARHAFYATIGMCGDFTSSETPPIVTAYNRYVSGVDRGRTGLRPDRFISSLLALDRITGQPVALAAKYPRILGSRGETLVRHFTALQAMGRLIGWHGDMSDVIRHDPITLTKSIGQYELLARFAAKYGTKQSKDTPAQFVATMIRVPIEYHLLGAINVVDGQRYNLGDKYWKTGFSTNATKAALCNELLMRTKEHAVAEWLGEQLLRRYFALYPPDANNHGDHPYFLNNPTAVCQPETVQVQYCLERADTWLLACGHQNLLSASKLRRMNQLIVDGSKPLSGIRSASLDYETIADARFGFFHELGWDNATSPFHASYVAYTEARGIPPDPLKAVDNLRVLFSYGDPTRMLHRSVATIGKPKGLLLRRCQQLVHAGIDMQVFYDTTPTILGESESRFQAYVARHGSA